jgi:hypothetical protein
MENNYWLFVINELRHLSEIKENEESWWCISRGCNKGDSAFLYKAGVGIVCYFEVIELMESNTFCSAYGMKTAEVKILKSFNPPIKSNELKLINAVRSEKFIKRNFQSKEFRIKNNAIINSILSIR